MTDPLPFFISHLSAAAGGSLYVHVLGFCYLCCRPLLCKHIVQQIKIVISSVSQMNALPASLSPVNFTRGALIDLVQLFFKAGPWGRQTYWS